MVGHLTELFTEREVDLIVTRIPILRAWRLGKPKGAYENHSE